MKAKEIIQRIHDALRTGIEAVDAVSAEVTDDFKRMHALATERKSQEAAFVRILREYNQKWNSVVSALKDDPAFLYEGKKFLHEDMYARFAVDVLYEKMPESEKQKAVDLVLKPQAFTNLQAFGLRQQKRIEQQTLESMRTFFGF